MRGSGSSYTARQLSRATLALAVAFYPCSPAWCIGDVSFDTPALRLAAATLLTGLALLCSPLFLLVTWASVRLVRVSEAGLGRAYLLVLAEIAIGILAMMCVPGFGRGEGAAHTVRSSVAAAIAVMMAMASAKFILATTWTKAVKTCLLSWAMIAVPLVLLFSREAGEWLSYQISGVR